MFELSDEEDNFWNDVPLGDITNTTTSKDAQEPVQNGLRMPSKASDNPAKRHCTEASLDHHAREASISSSTKFPSATEMLSAGEQVFTSTTVIPGSVSGRLSVARTGVSVAQDDQSPVIAGIRESLMTPVGTSAKASPGSTPRRPRRKFPGPAGLLPKLQPGQSMDSVLIPGITTSDPDKTNKEDTVILASQSSDDVFQDSPWQTLLQDLEVDGIQLMKTFSIATIPLKAGKKQLVKGKVAMVFAVIEALDTQGSDASVTLRDKSGRIQGTVHRDLLKDYEAELQPGTVIVLRQVSVISLTNKNHYLNITPANVIVMYQNKNNQLQKVKFHGSQDSLRSVLLSLEKKSFHSTVEGNGAHGTPSSLNSSRLTTGSSSTNTPVLFGASSNHSTPRSQGVIGASFTPRAQNGNFTPRAPGVRDVRFTPSAVRTPCATVRQTGTPQIYDKRPNPQTPNISMNSHIRLGNTHVPNTDSFRPVSFTKPENYSLSNRSLSTSGVNQNVYNTQTSASTGSVRPNLNQSTSNRTEINWKPNVIVSLEQKKSANVSSVTASHTNSHVTPGSVNSNSNEEVSPEFNSNKRKWSFKSPTSSPSVGVSQLLFPGPGQTSSVMNISVGNIKYNNTSAGSSENLVKVIQTGTKTETSNAMNFNAQNRQNNINSHLIGLTRTVENVQRKPGDFNNNRTISNVNANVEVNSNTSKNLSKNISAEKILASTVTKSKWSFKPRTVTSPTATEKSSPPLINKNKSHLTAGTGQNTEDLWQDDLSDDLLSQLSDEMM